MINLFGNPTVHGSVTLRLKTRDKILREWWGISHAKGGGGGGGEGV